MIRSKVVLSSSYLSSEKKNLLKFFENSETPHQGAQRHVLEGLKFLCTNLGKKNYIYCFINMLVAGRAEIAMYK